MEQLKKKIKTDDEREWRRIYFFIFCFLFFFFLMAFSPTPLYFFPFFFLIRIIFYCVFFFLFVALLGIVNWVDHSKTLREQGIDESETVLLRRKYFFSDGNVDSRDPVQLNLLFVQARDSILNGTHPVTLDKACEFAGIQCQAQFGDYIESKHKPGFLESVPLF
jgi:hypothetical protein